MVQGKKGQNTLQCNIYPLPLLVYANVPSRGWGLLMKCLEWNEDRMSAFATPHVPSAPMFIVRAGPSYLNPGKGLLRWDSTLRLRTKQWPNNCSKQKERKSTNKVKQDEVPSPERLGFVSFSSWTWHSLLHTNWSLQSDWEQPTLLSLTHIWDELSPLVHLVGDSAAWAADKFHTHTGSHTQT